MRIYGLIVSYYVDQYKQLEFTINNRGNIIFRKKSKG